MRNFQVAENAATDLGAVPAPGAPPASVTDYEDQGTIEGFRSQADVIAQSCWCCCRMQRKINWRRRSVTRVWSGRVLSASKDVHSLSACSVCQPASSQPSKAYSFHPTQRTKRTDRSGVCSCVASIASLALAAPTSSVQLQVCNAIAVQEFVLHCNYCNALKYNELNRDDGDHFQLLCCSCANRADDWSIAVALHDPR